MEETTKYNDIINLPHHVSKTRPRMSVSDRAAQFSPFSALTGHGDAIKETARLTTRRVELDEGQKDTVNRTLHYLMKNLEKQPMISITYFVPDELKNGGEYVTIRDVLINIKKHEKKLVLQGGTEILFEEIYEIEEN